MPKKHVLTREQMRIYASPVRQRLVACLRARGSASIAEVASDLDRRPDTLYHHVRLLLRCGLIVKSGERIAGKNREAIYAPIAHHFSADVDAVDPDYLREFGRLVRGVLADSAAHHERAFRERSEREKILFETVNVRLRPGQVAELNRQIADLVRKARDEADREGDRQLFAFLSCPVRKT